MGIVFRQSVKTTIVLLGGAFLGGLMIWLSTKFVPKQQLGFINSFARWALMLSAFVPLGLTSTLAVYIHRYANADRKRKMLITICLFIPLVVTCIISVIYLLVPSWLLRHFQPGDRALMGQYYVWLPVFTVLFFYMDMLNQYLCTQMKVAVSAFLREIVLRMFNIVLVVLYGLGYLSFPGLFTGTILTYLVPILVYVFIAARMSNFGLLFQANVFTAAEYRELAHFSWYHFLLTISLTFMNMMDVMLLPFYDHEGFTSVAVYVVATYIITLLNIPYKAFIQSTTTVMARAFTDNDLPKAKDIFVRSSVNLLIASVGIAMVLCCNLQNIVAVVGNGKNYTGIIPVFVIILMGQLVNFATGMNDQVLSITNYYKFNFYLSISLIAFMFLLIKFLVPIYGIYGAAAANALTFIFFNTAKCLYVWKKVGMQPFSKNTVAIIICGIPALAGGYFFPYLFEPARHVYIHTFADATMRSLLVAVIYIAMLLWLKPSKDLEEYLASVRQNKRLF